MTRTNREKLKELQTTLEQIEQKAQQVEQKINESQVFLDQISQHKTNAEQWCREIETTKSQSVEASGEIKALKEEIEETKEELTEKLNAVEVKKEDIDKFFIKIFGGEDEQGKRTGGLSTRLSQKEKEADTFLNTQEKKYKELFEKIESLLPGATSTGLAQAYYDQKISYKWPVIIWAIVFVLALVGVFITGLLSYENGIKLSFEELLNVEQATSKLIARIPFFFALIWLAVFSSKQHRQNKRLEQEYAHKEVLAKSYQGYKQELESQGKTATDREIIGALHKVLIATIAKNPSEIMDDGCKEDTPSIWTKPLNLTIFGKDKKDE
jgi:DNA repair exonuclease SbcCD ATPase subunit